LNKNGDVLLDEKIPQPTSFLNYEAAINTVIIQVEKYDPKISAKYWLSTFGVHDVLFLIAMTWESRLRYISRF